MGLRARCGCKPCLARRTAPDLVRSRMVFRSSSAIAAYMVSVNWPMGLSSNVASAVMSEPPA